MNPWESKLSPDRANSALPEELSGEATLQDKVTMNWAYVMTELDAHLSDEKVHRDVEEFFEIVGWTSSLHARPDFADSSHDGWRSDRCSTPFPLSLRTWPAPPRLTGGRAARSGLSAFTHWPHE